MKKTLIIAMAVLMGCALTANAAGKDKKKGKKGDAAAVEQVALANASDSLSYAAGKSFTRGLLPFLKQQYGVGDNELPAFIKGFEDAMKIKSDGELKGYSAGMQIMAMVETRMLPGLKEEMSGDSISTDLFNKGFVAAIKKDDSVLADSVANTLYEAKAKEMKEAKEREWKKAGEDFLAENAKKEGVVTLPDGLQYKVITAGEGEKPKATDRVVVKYEGKTIDGKVFDSSYKRNPQTNTFGVSQLIKGWTEALQLMPVGSKWELYIPYNLAYGEAGAGANIKPYSALVFTMELVDIEKPAEKNTDAKAADTQAAKTKGAKTVKRTAKK